MVTRPGARAGSPSAAAPAGAGDRRGGRAALGSRARGAGGVVASRLARRPQMVGRRRSPAAAAAPAARPRTVSNSGARSEPDRARLPVGGRSPVLVQQADLGGGEGTRGRPDRSGGP